MNMLDYMIAMSSKPTKYEFGKIMHSDDEELKKIVLETTEMLGGYDNLED